MVINDVSEVNYCAKRDALYCKHLFIVKTIFNDVTDFLQEATGDNVKEFLNCGLEKFYLVLIKEGEQYDEMKNINKSIPIIRKLITAILS